MISRLALASVLIPGLLSAQALAEYAAGMARAAGSAAPAGKVAKSAGTALQKAGGALQGTAERKPAQRARTGTGRAASTPVVRYVGKAPESEETQPTAVFEDPFGIAKGMEYAEVIRRFGPPAVTLTTGPNHETLCYTRDGRQYDAEVRDGKVTAVSGSGTEKPSGGR